MIALEFYSGIGGLHYALLTHVPDARVVAFDINDLANDVYEHNFGSRPVQTNISTLTAKKLDSWAADIWLLSPPCQPYTRRGLKKQSGDARATSFLGVLDLLPALKHPPKYLLVENVVGFETSDTREALAAALKAADFQLQEFIVTPSQLGIPYSRPRYFALAKRGGAFSLPTPAEGESPLRHPPSCLLAAAAARGSGGGCGSLEAAVEGCTAVRPLGEFLVASPADELEGGVRAKLPNFPNFAGFKRSAPIREGLEAPAALLPRCPQDPQHEEAQAQQEQQVGAAGSQLEGPLAMQAQQQLGQLVGEQQLQHGPGSNDAWAAFRVPEEVVRKHGRCFDLVSAASTSSNCFTKTYGQYVKGSGSLVATRNLEVLQQLRDEDLARVAAATPAPSTAGAAGEVGLEEELEGDEAGDGCAAASGIASERERQGRPDTAAEAEALFGALLRLGLRYFTPREIANLHSFPPTFGFPPHVTLRQRYSLLGNSLSVAVVADLLAYLFTEPAQPVQRPAGAP